MTTLQIITKVLTKEHLVELVTELHVKQSLIHNQMKECRELKFKSHVSGGMMCLYPDWCWMCAYESFLKMMEP